MAFLGLKLKVLRPLSVVFLRVLRFSTTSKNSMPSNIEIKARIQDIEKVKKIASSCSQSSGEIINQVDTFFNVPNGRLKLRELQNGSAKLIFYDRSNITGPKLSNYTVTLISNPEDLKETLSSALGILGVVKKQRTLYLIGQTRIHLDKVEGLGNYLEFEVALEENQSVESGKQIAEDLMQKFEVLPNDLIAEAYVDYLLKEINTTIKT